MSKEMNNRELLIELYKHPLIQEMLINELLSKRQLVELVLLETELEEYRGRTKSGQKKRRTRKQMSDLHRGGTAYNQEQIEAWKKAMAPWKKVLGKQKELIKKDGKWAEGTSTAKGSYEKKSRSALKQLKDKGDGARERFLRSDEGADERKDFVKPYFTVQLLSLIHI